MSWNEGYVADIGYTYGYYTELNPLRTRLAMLNAGVAAPEIKTACELGFGQGVSVNIHAAATTTTWAGTDFNPSQANFAQELGRSSGSDVLLADQAFSEFCGRDDLPNFDYIGLHGIWSWISDANRKVISDFVARKLNVGGVLYISYNTQPGWSNFAPMRHLMVQHEQRMSAPGSGIASRIEDAIGFADKLLETNPGYLKANPAAKARFEPLKTQNRNYLAHEYFNQDWHPMYFADMAKWLADAKMTYACSANYLDQVNGINFTEEQAKLLSEIPDQILAQTARDFLVNQQFRKDYWVKGPITLRRADQLAQIRAERVVLVNARDDVSLKANGPMGEVVMHENVYGPVLDVLADNQARTIGEIEAAVEPKGIGLLQVIEVMLVMGSQGQITSAQSKEVAKACRKRTHDLNRHLIKCARTGGEVAVLASPVTGGGIGLGRFGQLFVEAVQQGKKTSAELAQHVWAILAAQGQAIVKEGKVIEGEAANVAELQSQADAFLKKQLPILRALEVTN